MNERLRRHAIIVLAVPGNCATSHLTSFKYFASFDCEREVELTHRGRSQSGYHDDSVRRIHHFLGVGGCFSYMYSPLAREGNGYDRGQNHWLSRDTRRLWFLNYIRAFHVDARYQAEPGIGSRPHSLDNVTARIDCARTAPVYRVIVPISAEKCAPGCRVRKQQKKKKKAKPCLTSLTSNKYQLQ